jgi:uncharacterized SAM-binding protein YcdF (DUF218 family)
MLRSSPGSGPSRQTDPVPPAPAPLVVADAARVAGVVAALAANRRAARGGTRDAPPPGLAVVSLAGDGTLLDASGVPTAAPDLMAARELVVTTTGTECAEALRGMLDLPPDARRPGALIRDHPRLTVIADRAAAGLLRPQAAYDSDTVLLVLGHREPGISAEHRISDESRARLRRAARLLDSRPVRAAILSGYTSTGGLSEAEQMKQAWPEHRAPALLEVAGRTTAENASRSLPLVLALGGVARVVVVSSTWHVRVPYFFMPYRRFGLRVAYRSTALHGNWPRMLHEELHGLPHARRQRREAMATVVAALSDARSAAGDGVPARRS